MKNKTIGTAAAALALTIGGAHAFAQTNKLDGRWEATLTLQFRCGV